MNYISFVSGFPKTEDFNHFFQILENQILILIKSER